MLQLSEKFVDPAKGILIQPLPYERVLETRPEARQSLDNILDGFICIFGGKKEWGDDKNETTAMNKAVRDYDGELRCVTDIVRAKLVVSSPEMIQNIRSFGFQHILDEHGAEIAGQNDLFDDPKDDTGYRCINMKISVPVNEDKTEHHIVELQIVAEQIEAVYDQTHVYKRRAEEAADEIKRLEKETMFEGVSIIDLKNMEQLGDEISPAQEKAMVEFEKSIRHLKHIEKINYEACRLENSIAARGETPENNYESLLSDDPYIRDKHSLTPEKEVELEAGRHEADRLATQTLE